MPKHRSFLRAPLALAISGLALALHVQAASAQPVRFDIAAQPLATALDQFARQAGLQLVFAPQLAQGRQAPAVQGAHEVRQALDALLRGSGLAGHVEGGTLTVERVAAAQPALGAVTVTAQAERDGTTEGTGAYVSAAPLTTATPLGLTLRETPQSVSVVTNQRMEDQALTTIHQTLIQAPGVLGTSWNTELGEAKARGYTLSNYQFDGTSTFTQLLGAGGIPAQAMADMALYDRVEVLRGASGLITGAGDPSGAVNMVRKKPTAEFQGSVEAGIGSWNDKRAVLDLSAPLNAARSVRGRLIAVGQDGDSYTDHYGKSKGLLYGVVEADLTDRTLLTVGLEHERTRIKGQSRHARFPLWFSDGTRTDLPRSFTTASRDNYLHLNTTKAFATLEQGLGNDWALKLSANHWRMAHDEELVYLRFNNRFANTAGNGARLDAIHNDNHTEQSSVDVNLRGPFTLFGRQHELVLGLAYERYDHRQDPLVDASGLHGAAANLYTWDRTGKGVYESPWYSSKSPMRQSSIYAATRLQLADDLKLVLGARVFDYDRDWIEYDADGVQDYESPVSGRHIFTPYGGLVYDIDGAHTAYASYAAIHNPQTAWDRTGAMLDPVEGANYEVGLKSGWLGGRLNTAVALYQILQDNLSESDPGYFVPGTPDKPASRAVKGARTRGMDLEVSGALTRNWNMSASWTYSQTRNAQGERITTTFPRHMVKLWTTYRLPGDWSRLTVGGGVNWQSRIYSTVNAWQLDRDLYWEQKPYAVASLMARYEFSDQLSATLNINNLFDKKYIASVADWFYSGNYGAPRSVALNLKYRF